MQTHGSQVMCLEPDGPLKDRTRRHGRRPESQNPQLKVTMLGS